MNKMNVGYFWVSEMGLMLRLKSFMGHGLFVVSWKTLMSWGSVKGGEEYLRLDGFKLKVMGGGLKESWTTCKDGQRISESQRGG